MYPRSLRSALAGLLFLDGVLSQGLGSPVVDLITSVHQGVLNVSDPNIGRDLVVVADRT